MKKEYLEDLSFDELMEWAKENLDCITDEETLKQFAIEKVKEDYFGLAIHILNAIWDNPYTTDYYRYDYSMGALETPTPITEYADIEDLIFDEE